MIGAAVGVQGQAGTFSDSFALIEDKQASIKILLDIL